MNQKIEELDVSARLKNVLHSLEIDDLDSAFKISDEEWAKMRNVGAKSLRELKELFRVHGYYDAPKEEKPADEVYSFRPKNLKELLDSLQEREKYVVCHKLGLLGETPKTFEMIGKLVNVNKERVSQIYKKALRSLRHQKRGRFFALMPDCLMEAVFETLNINEIFDQFYRKDDLNLDRQFNWLQNSISEKIDEKNKEIHSFMKEVKNNYERFVNVLQGSEFLKYLRMIDQMATRLESQTVNIQSTLQIAQKYLTQEIKIPQVELNKMLGELDTRIFQVKELFVKFDELERDFRNTLEFKKQELEIPKKPLKTRKFKRI